MKLGPLGLALFLALPASFAAAQPLGWPERRVLQYEEDGSGNFYTRGAYGQLCMRWCPHDMVPCDPPHFKIADGRCQDRRGNR